MAERSRATASGRSRPAPTAAEPAAARHSTARVATTAGVRKSELPGWFWGALGCMTVLVVGLAVVFLMGQGTPAAPGTSAPAAAAAATASVAPTPSANGGTPDVQRARAGIRVEPMAPPPAAAILPAAAPPVARVKAQARPIKVARSPGPAARPTVAAKPASGGAQPAADSDADEEELLKPKPRAAAPADDDQSAESN